MTDKCQAAALEFRLIAGLIAKLGREDFEQRMQREGYDISGLQFGVIGMLAMDGEHSLKELSAKFMLDPSTLVATVDALERKNIVTRHRDATDRRRVVIGLTERGIAIAQRFHQVDPDDVIYRTMQAMGEQDVEQLLVLLRRFVHHMPHGATVIDNIFTRLRAAKVHAQPGDER